MVGFLIKRSDQGGLLADNCPLLKGFGAKTTLPMADTLLQPPFCEVTATAHQLHLVNALEDSAATLHFCFLQGFLWHIA